MSDFPFGIEYVCSLLGLQERLYSGDRRSFYIDCPFCGKKRKMNINIEKNIYRCPACDEAGGMLKLYKELTGRNLMAEWREANPVLVHQQAIRKKEIASMPKVAAAAPLEVRDKAYASLLSVLELSPSHRDDLLRRGLTDSAIRYFGYRSLPRTDLAGIARKVQNLAGTIEAVPGFYGTEDNPKFVWRKTGFLIPVRQPGGNISGMQIRYDSLPENASQEQKDSFKKYIWLTSSEEKTGTSIGGCENIHFSGFYRGYDFQRVYLTEGVLKADIASFLSRSPFVGLTGVGNTGRLPEVLNYLKGIGTREIYVCLDMDYQTNKNVYKALNKIHNICEESGLTHVQVNWDPAYKGIDDFLLYKKKNGLL